MSHRIRLRHTRPGVPVKLALEFPSYPRLPRVSRYELNQVQQPSKRWERAIPQANTPVYLSARFPRRSAGMAEVGDVRVCEAASHVCREIGWSVPAALLVHRQLRGHAMLRCLVVLDQDLAQRIFGRARELLLARIAAHLDGTCVGGDAPKSVAGCASCELLVEAIAESCHGDHTFDWLPRAA